ncbi:hypothetical protein RHMOL_Rhmol01G0171000 [Rhododendron molle]|uniref:Uncharacterized protein n=1 Tax=Rhododendron molle TaxID=49168 RepID=A0ACC0Q2N0_RHOML|nr:hypothetical protein RHMOL_Rhmol01G0171000 [Rhododendron molle]
MASGGDGELTHREEMAVVAATAAMEVDIGSAVMPAQERVVGEDSMAVSGAGEGLVAVESSSRVLAEVGNMGDSEVVRGDSGELATSSRDALGGGGDGISSGGGATGTPHTPTVEELLAAAERANVVRGRGARPPAGGRGASSSGRGESSTGAPEAAETSTPLGLPTLEWTIGVRDPSGARVMLDIPRLPQPSMRLLAQVPREWAEKAIMLMVGMRQLLKDCAKGRTLQTRPVPEPALPVAARVQPRRSTRTQPQGTVSLLASTSTRGRGTQRAPRSATEVRQFEILPKVTSRRRPALEESEEETEELFESRALESTDSSTASGPSDDEDNVESSGSEGRQQKRSRRV